MNNGVVYHPDGPPCARPLPLVLCVCVASLSHLEADAEGEGKRDDDDDPRDAGQEKSAQPDAADAGFGFVG